VVTNLPNGPVNVPLATNGTVSLKRSSKKIPAHQNHPGKKMLQQMPRASYSMMLYQKKNNASSPKTMN